MAENPCTSGEPGGRGGFGGFGGGGNAGPHVSPGTYTVALVAGGRTLDSKPLRIIMDPEARLTVAERTRWNAITAELHDVQRRGNAVQQSLNTLHPQMTDIAGKIGGMANVPANLKTQFEALNRDYEAVRVKFGVPSGAAAAAGRGGGGGGRGGGAADNALGRLGASKNAIMGIWEPPSAAMSRQAAAARTALIAAIGEANAVIARARTLGTALRPHNLTLQVP
jgi:hypothetical protein